MKIGFIGLGMMGSGMAANLQRAGHDLIVHDLRRVAAEPYLSPLAQYGRMPRAPLPKQPRSFSPRCLVRPKSRPWRWAKTAF